MQNPHFVLIGNGEEEIEKLRKEDVIVNEDCTTIRC